MRSRTPFFPLIPPDMNADEYGPYCEHVVEMMTTNIATFPAPDPSLVLVSAHIEALKDKQEAVRKGNKCAVPDRDIARYTLNSDMRSLKVYVQRTAEEQADKADLIILSSGMNLGKRATRVKLPLAARRAKVSGTVIVEAKAVRGPVQYQWQMSEDQSTWTDLPHTFLASTSASGLTAGKTYWFRSRTLTKSGLSDWTTPVSIIAL